MCSVCAHEIMNRVVEKRYKIPAHQTSVSSVCVCVCVHCTCEYMNVSNKYARALLLFTIPVLSSSLAFEPGLYVKYYIVQQPPRRVHRNNTLARNAHTSGLAQTVREYPTLIHLPLYHKILLLFCFFSQTCIAYNTFTY